MLSPLGVAIWKFQIETVSYNYLAEKSDGENVWSTRFRSSIPKKPFQANTSAFRLRRTESPLDLLSVRKFRTLKFRSIHCKSVWIPTAFRPKSNRLFSGWISFFLWAEFRKAAADRITKSAAVGNEFYWNLISRLRQDLFFTNRAQLIHLSSRIANAASLKLRRSAPPLVTASDPLVTDPLPHCRQLPGVFGRCGTRTPGRWICAPDVDQYEWTLNLSVRYLPTIRLNFHCSLKRPFMRLKFYSNRLQSDSSADKWNAF